MTGTSLKDGWRILHERRINEQSEVTAPPWYDGKRIPDEQAKTYQCGTHRVVNNYLIPERNSQRIIYRRSVWQAMVPNRNR